MSKGNKAVKVRLSPASLDAIENEIARKRRHYATPADFSVSDFIREAIAEKLDHVKRNAKASRKRRLSASDPMLVEKFESLIEKGAGGHYFADGSMGVLS